MTSEQEHYVGSLRIEKELTLKNTISEFFRLLRWVVAMTAICYCVNRGLTLEFVHSVQVDTVQSELEDNEKITNFVT